MGSFSIYHWLIVVVLCLILYGLSLVLYGLIKLLRGKGGSVMFCKNCGHTGKTKSNTPGNIAIEIILWLCFFVPGLIYSIWRISNKAAICHECNSKDIVPTNSPVAIANNKEFSA